MKVLVVEDEALIAKALQRELTRLGFEVSVCDTGSTALSLTATWSPDIALLDLMLPDMDGMDVARQIRAETDLPIIMLTARGQESERIAGLEAGADDYIVKPFSMPELVARIRAVRRRFEARPAAPPVARHRDLELDLNRYRATKAGRDLELTHKEFELLRMLMANPGAIVRRAELIGSIWGIPPAEGGNTLDVHVSVLRKKLGDDARTPQYIETIRSVGFRLTDT